MLSVSASHCCKTIYFWCYIISMLFRILAFFFFFLIFNYSEDFLSQKFSSPCLLQYYLDSKTWPSLWNDPHEFILSISPGFWNHMLFNLYVHGPQLISTELKKKQVLDHKLADVVRYALSSIMDGFPRFSISWPAIFWNWGIRKCWRWLREDTSLHCSNEMADSMQWAFCLAWPHGNLIFSLFFFFTVLIEMADYMLQL